MALTKEITISITDHLYFFFWSKLEKTNVYFHSSTVEKSIKKLTNLLQLLSNEQENKIKQLAILSLRKDYDELAEIVSNYIIESKSSEGNLIAMLYFIVRMCELYAATGQNNKRNPFIEGI